MPDAGPVVGEPIEFDASESLPAREDGRITEWHWEMYLKPAGARITLSDPSAPRFVVTGDQPGDYEVRVIVCDNSGSAGLGAARVTLP